MTPEEQQLLTSLTQKINQTQLQEKDPDAENLLGHELGANPDALYILAQTVLVQNIALDQAKAQVAQLQQQLQQARQQPAHTTSFLGRLLGDRDPQPAPPPPPPYQAVPQYQPPVQAQYAPPPPPQYQQPQYVAGSQPSFLGSAMRTAAGVAAGALAFEGVESILHGFGHGGYGPGMMGMGMGSGMGLGGGGFERPVEETVVNNYYDQPGGGAEHHFHETGDQIGDRGGAQFSDASYRTSGDSVSSGDDQMGYDNSNSDAGGFDDSSSSGDDGGGGFDDGGGFGGDSGGDVV